MSPVTPIYWFAFVIVAALFAASAVVAYYENRSDKRDREDWDALTSITPVDLDSDSWDVAA